MQSFCLVCAQSREHNQRMSCTWVHPYWHQIIIDLFLLSKHVDVTSQHELNTKCPATVELRYTVYS